MRTLSLNQIAAPNLGCEAFLNAAAEAGFGEVSLFATPVGVSEQALVTWDNATAIETRLKNLNLKVRNLECFLLTPETAIDQFSPLLELASDLGARGIGAVIFDNDEKRITDNLNRLAEQADQLSLHVGVEFMGLTPGWRTLGEMATLVKSLNRPNLGVTIDILHLIRTGGCPEDIRSLDRKYIAHTQLCDGANLDVTNSYGDEAAHARLLPGEGVFPLKDFISALPEDLCLELEVPQQSALPDRDRLQRIMASVEPFIDR